MLKRVAERTSRDSTALGLDGSTAASIRVRVSVFQRDRQEQKLEENEEEKEEEKEEASKRADRSFRRPGIYWRAHAGENKYISQ